MKARNQFVCQQCGATYTKWVGQCTNCQAWNSLVEQIVESTSAKSALAKGQVSGKKLDFVKIASLTPSEDKARLDTGFSELNTVLGGGILLGSVSLLAGQPGIGKSTILMQICSETAKTRKVLYISGEESAGQVKLRASRLGAKGDKLHFASSTSGNDIAKTIESGEFDLVIVDSIQTLAMDEISSAPGTVSQVTNCGNLIIRAAKATDTAIIIVGHVTKEGTLAGPKVLEHLVDVVLNFEGDRYGGFKTVRAVKNRFGSTNEVAIFEMVDKGLKEVQNPSAALLAERTNTDGSIILATLEGNRPILVEIQALATTSNFGYPKRTSSGFDINRLNLLIAVLERRTKLKLSDKDIFVNVVGGMKLADSAADLAVCMAIASAVAGRKLGEEYVVFGEVGLGGEIRSAFRSDQRIAEAKKLGFKHAIAPATIKDKFVVPAKDLREVLIKYVNKILGIDPGIGICGFGLIDASIGRGAKALDYGVVKTTVDAPLPSRLKELYDNLTEVFDQTKPDMVAVEKLFFSKNITTGIAVAEARGIVLLVAEQHGLPVYEYSPNQIKKALTGYGSATKSQMQEMARVHLNLEKKPKPDDAADALAVAITCSFFYQLGPDDQYKFSNSRKKVVK